MNLLRSYSFFVALFFCLCIIVNNSNFFVAGAAKISYTAQEKAAIVRLRALVGDRLTQDYQKKDGFLLRWIRSYDFDINKAHTQLEKSLKWRKEKNMDSILEGDTGASKRDLPYNVDGVDRAGRPIVLIGWGKWLLRKYIVAGKRHDVLKEFKRMTERTIRKVFERADKTGEDIDQFYFIGEFQGFNRRENMCVACIPLTLEIASVFDSTASVFVKNLTCINMPKYFKPVLSLVKEVFGLLVLKTLTDFDYDKSQWQPALLKDIAADQLPKSIGGA